MNKNELLQKLQKTKISGVKSLKKLGEIIRREFDNPETKEERAFELLVLAYKFNIPQFDEMLSDYSLSDFKWF
jgi:hypothetical protein